MSRWEDYQERLKRWSDIQDHLPFLYGTAASYPAPVIFELGVRTGFSTSAFLAVAEDKDRGALWSADIANPAVPHSWKVDPRWHFCLGDDLSLEVQKWFPAKCDVLFIDTAHGYVDTLAELHSYVPRVRPGGVVLCHDTQWNRESVSLPEPGGPVTEALDLFCWQTGRQWVNRHSGPGWFGLGVVRI